jgi:hypothetical protein
MRKLIPIGIVLLVTLAGCGLESLFSGAAHGAYPRPASKVRGAVSWTGGQAHFDALDGAGASIAPFQVTVSGTGYEEQLPSSSYSMIRPQVRVGALLLRAILPRIGPESAVDGVDLDARNVTEALIVEARLSATGGSFSKLTPDAYVGDGLTNGTRTLIRKDFDVAGPTQDLLLMVDRLMKAADPTVSSSNPGVFTVPVLDASYKVTSSPIDGAGWLPRANVDYTGDGIKDIETTDFDLKLAEVAQLYDPTGCEDTHHIRVVFTVDFDANAKDGNGNTVNRFRWASDKPGKRMFLAAWVHKDSEVQDTSDSTEPIGPIIGSGTPNVKPMYDDGTNGDDVAGDGIWTIYYDLPFDAARKLRLGYKYTWGFAGNSWTGTEEWPGNSRLLEVVDVGPISAVTGKSDGFVHRRDVFSDEATNKDKMNLNLKGTGIVTWTTDVRGCGLEVQEQMSTLHNAQTCEAWITPKSIGPVKVACPAL